MISLTLINSRWQTTLTGTFKKLQKIDKSLEILDMILEKVSYATIG